MLVLNKVDMISKHEYRQLEKWFASRGEEVIGTNGQTGQGVPKLVRRAVSVSSEINERRAAKGLLPREVRAAVIGFPNIGKSALINRLMKRKACESDWRMPKKGARWVLQVLHEKHLGTGCK